MSHCALEQAACPISGSTEFELRYTAPDRFHLSGGEVWQVVTARASGLTLLSPRPTQAEIGKFYDALDYDPFISLRQATSWRERTYKFIREFISLRYKARQVLRRANLLAGRVYNVLEIGCATGDFLLALRRHSDAVLNLTGIEISEKAARYARDENELVVYHGELLTVQIDEPQDLIVMWHTLEHIHRLNETLDKLRRLLRRNGLFVTAMPNLNSLDAQHYGKYWVALDAPRHLYHFTPESFAALLGKHRLRIVDMHGLPLDSYYNALLSEQLCAAMQGQSSGIGTVLRAIWWGSLAAINGITPELASSVCYYVKHVD
ncbi:MAG: class I SAM-dependent methyltransferase [Chloroherpetonaceae bacterium]|nr:class I SAM-dependent methyltransferase [Chloroherpetonaceae bacterium]MCS7210772.1 class I SAM-dependent methyltransferase [Chloroherpetonaceae bacterium]MDW8019928.1 class I SAM-dependent methyltransferase [Chloroherpetonaceae bacterium]